MKSKPTYYDLSVSQNILVYSQMFSLYKQLNNVFSLILLDRELDFEVLRKAIATGYEHCDTMRLRLTRVKLKLKQYYLPSDPPKIEMLDFTGKTQAEMDAELSRLAGIPIRLTNRPLHRTYLVKSWDGLQGIMLGVSHLAMDSWSICVLLKYVMDIYESLKNGKDMPTPLKPYEELLIKELEYKVSPQYQKDREFWLEEYKKPEPYFTHILGSGELERRRQKKHRPDLRAGQCTSLKTRANHEIIMIPADQVAKMEEYCRKNMIPMQALFIMGIRTALSARNDRQPDVSINNAVARRGTQHEKRSGGTRINVLILRNILPEDCTFASALQQISERQSLIFRHAEFGLLDVYKIRQDSYTKGDPMATYECMALTFQPVPMALNDGTVIKSKWIGNGVAAQPFYLTVMDGDGTGALRCYYEYWKQTFTPEIVRQFHSEIVKTILAGVENDGITVGDLLDLLKPESAAT